MLVHSNMMMFCAAIAPVIHSFRSGTFCDVTIKANQRTSYDVRGLTVNIARAQHRDRSK